MLFNAITIVGLLFGAFIVLVVAMRMFRRSIVKREMDSHTDFSIADLHRLHQEGNLSAEEFERAKATVLARKPAAAADKARGFEVIQEADQSNARKKTV